MGLYGFNLHFPGDFKVEHVFIHFFDTILVKCQFKSPAYFPTGFGILYIYIRIIHIILYVYSCVYI